MGMWPYWAIRVATTAAFVACGAASTWAFLRAPSTWTVGVVLGVWATWRFGVSRWLDELRTLG